MGNIDQVYHDQYDGFMIGNIHRLAQVYDRSYHEIMNGFMIAFISAEHDGFMIPAFIMIYDAVYDAVYLHETHDARL